MDGMIRRRGKPDQFWKMVHELRWNPFSWIAFRVVKLTIYEKLESPYEEENSYIGNVPA